VRYKNYREKVRKEEELKAKKKAKIRKDVYRKLGKLEGRDNDKQAKRDNVVMDE